MVSTALPDLDQLDIEAWKALVVERHEVHVEALSSQTQQIERIPSGKSILFVAFER
jgi:hypothetical protein